MIPREDEWYPRECEFCTQQAAIACRDPYCREQRHGEPWEDADPQEDQP